MEKERGLQHNVDIIFLFRSQPANYKQLNQNIKLMTNNDKPLLVIGDFNFCFLDKSSNATKSYLSREHFTQLIRQPTHIVTERDELKLED